jgi:hypothetical protein
LLLLVLLLFLLLMLQLAQVCGSSGAGAVRFSATLAECERASVCETTQLTSAEDTPSATRAEQREQTSLVVAIHHA